MAVWGAVPLKKTVLGIISPLQPFIPRLVPLKSHEVSHKLIIAFPILDYPLVNIQKKLWKITMLLMVS